MGTVMNQLNELIKKYNIRDNVEGYSLLLGYEGISSNEFRLLCLFASMLKAGMSSGVVTPSVKELKILLNWGRNRVIATTASLAKKGLIGVHRRGLTLNNEYHVYALSCCAEMINGSLCKVDIVEPVVQEVEDYVDAAREQMGSIKNSLLDAAGLSKDALSLVVGEIKDLIEGATELLRQVENLVDKRGFVRSEIRDGNITTSDDAIGSKYSLEELQNMDFESFKTASFYRRIDALSVMLKLNIDEPVKECFYNFLYYKLNNYSSTGREKRFQKALLELKDIHVAHFLGNWKLDRFSKMSEGDRSNYIFATLPRIKGQAERMGYEKVVGAPNFS